MQGRFWLQLDNNAPRDPKFLEAYYKMGTFKSFGCYCILIGRMNGEDGYFKLDDIGLFAWEWHESEEDCRKLIDIFIESELFIKTLDNRIFSKRLIKDIEDFQKQVEKGKSMAIGILKTNDGRMYFAEGGNE